MHAALWIGPLLILSWAVISGLGRTAVLKRLDAALCPAPFTLILLQLLRMMTLAAVCVGWYLRDSVGGRRQRSARPRRTWWLTVLGRSFVSHWACSSFGPW